MFDRWFGATVRLVPCSIPGLVIIEVEGQGFVVMDAPYAYKRFFKLFPERHRWMYGGLSPAPPTPG